MDSTLENWQAIIYFILATDRDIHHYTTDASSHQWPYREPVDEHLHRNWVFQMQS